MIKQAEKTHFNNWSALESTTTLALGHPAQEQEWYLFTIVFGFRKVFKINKNHCSYGASKQRVCGEFGKIECLVILIS